MRTAKDVFITAAVRADGADAKGAEPIRPLNAGLSAAWLRRRLLNLQEQLGAHQFPNVRAFRNSLASKAAMLKRVLVATWGA